MNSTTEQDAIRKLKERFNFTYSPDSDLTAIEQLEIHESLTESQPLIVHLSSIKKDINNTNGNENVSVNVNVNDTYKRRVNLELTKRKLEVITELKSCNYRTTPPKVAGLLEELFLDNPSKEGHWLYVAQTWNPRTINRVIYKLIKLHSSGAKTIMNPSAYFTYLIKFRAKRKDL